ncbi:ATP-binding protein [uncultured Methanoregula sp.]|uniref:ATP-binding protein n=1 Tax=uncultured Methanoregula sp. TaxID=1005933 RepID=UPI002AAAC44D|nr:ATP-binding protein [uncultured Methanoregula sp.]
MSVQRSDFAITVPWQKSLATRMSRATILIVVFALIATGAGLIWIAYNAEVQSTFHLQEARAERVALLIADFTANAKSELQLFKGIESLDTMSPEEQKQALENLLILRSDLFSQLTLLDKEGAESVKVSRFHTYLPNEMGSQATSAAFLSAINGFSYVSPAYISPDSGLLSVQIAVPLTSRDKKIVGVLTSEVNVVQLWQDVYRTRIGDTGYAYLVDGNGRFIAYQESSKVFQDYGKDMRGIPPVAEFVAGGPGKTPHVREYRGLTGEQVIGVYAPISGTSWAVIAELPTQEAYASITRMILYLAGLILLSVVMTGLLIFVISRRIIMPIRTLTGTAQRMGAGDLDAEVIEVQRQDEVGVLARTFSRMQGELKALYKGMEHQVEELKVAQEDLLSKNVELNAAYEKLAASEEKYRTIFENIQDVFYRSDSGGKLILISPSGASMLGYRSPDELIGFSIADRIYANPGDRVAFLEAMKEKGFVQNYEVSLIRKDGSVVTASTNSHYYYHADGNIAGVEGILRDITKLKQAELRLLEAHRDLEKKVLERTRELSDANLRLLELDRLKSLFIASMSHELRTPLNSIIGFTGIMAKGMAGEINAEQKKQLGMVQDSARHLLALINDVIDISKIEAGKIEADVSTFNLADVIREVKNTFGPAVHERGLVLNIEMCGPIAITSDERRVRQIILNLISNAIKFTDEGRVDLTVTQKGTVVEVSVRDTGIGIKKEDLEQLFRPFVRAMVPGRLTEGTGLGLYLSKKLARFLGGDIVAESELHKGSIFTFTFPVTYEKQEDI